MGKVHEIFSNKPFKIFYNGLIPRHIRKRWAYESNMMVQKEIASEWNLIIKDYFKGKIKKHKAQPLKPELVGKRVIWQYWGQGLDDLPEIVQISFNSIDKFKGDYKVIRITDANLKEYLETPKFVTNKLKDGTLKHVFFSDLLRVLLLSVYGGVWLDASILLTNNLPKKFADYNFFVFSRDPNSDNLHWGEGDAHFYFNWREDFKVKHLSSVMFSKPSSDISNILSDLLLYYWENKNDVEHYFFFQILINELKENNYVNFDFPIVDDSLPHLLQSCLEKPFNKLKYKDIVTKASIHKLTIHGDFKEVIRGKKTYYGHLKENFL